MRVFIAGGTGFVGRHLVRTFLERGQRVRLLVRPGSKARLEPHPRLDHARGDLFTPDLFRMMRGCHAAVNLVGIIRERPREGETFERVHIAGVRHFLAAAKTARVNQILHMSVLGAHPHAPTRFWRTRAVGEELVRANPLPWVIFRPSLIFGPGDRSVNFFASKIRRFHLFPIPGDGRFRSQPVSVWDVAEGFYATFAAGIRKKIFEVGGPRVYTFRSLIETIAALLREKVLIVPIPLPLAMIATLLFESLPFFPLTQEQLIMLTRDNLAHGTDFQKLLRHPLHSLEEEFPRYYYQE